MTKKDIILEYFKNKKTDHKYSLKKNNWVSKYETVKSLHEKTNIPTSTIYRLISEIKGTKGFNFSNGIISYDQIIL
jgi:hypothetical protein